MISPKNAHMDTIFRGIFDHVGLDHSKKKIIFGERVGYDPVTKLVLSP